MDASVGAMGASKNIEKSLIFIAFPWLGPWEVPEGPWEVPGGSLGAPGRPWDVLGQIGVVPGASQAVFREPLEQPWSFSKLLRASLGPPRGYDHH